MKNTQLKQEKRWFLAGGVLTAIILILAIVLVDIWPASAVFPSGTGESVNELMSR